MNWTRNVATLLSGFLAALLSLDATANMWSQGPSTDKSFVSSAPDITSLGTGPSDVAAWQIATATREAERALALINGLGSEPTQAFEDYLRALHNVVPSLQSVNQLTSSNLRFFITGLSVARKAFEDSIEDGREWRRFARIVEPDARLIPVPTRFIRTVEVEPRPLKRLNEYDREAWLGDD